MSEADAAYQQGYTRGFGRGVGANYDDLLKTIDFIRQTVHRAHHDGPIDECKKSTCDAALKALGRRL